MTRTRKEVRDEIALYDRKRKALMYDRRDGAKEEREKVEKRLQELCTEIKSLPYEKGMFAEVVRRNEEKGLY